MKKHHYQCLLGAIIFLPILIISGCGQRGGRNYGTLIDEESSQISDNQSGEGLTESSLENNCEMKTDDGSNLLDITYPQDSIVKARIYSQEDYDVFCDQLESDENSVRSTSNCYSNLPQLENVKKILEKRADEEIAFLDKYPSALRWI